MSDFSIPLIAGNQQFTIRLGDQSFKFLLLYRESARGGAWFLDIELSDGSNAVKGIPVVSGVDLLEQFKYKKFGTLRCYVTGGSDRPSFDDLGKSVTLVWSE